MALVAPSLSLACSVITYLPLWRNSGATRHVHDRAEQPPAVRILRVLVRRVVVRCSTRFIKMVGVSSQNRKVAVTVT